MANLLWSTLYGLFDQMDEIRRAKLSQGLERLCSRIDGRLKLLLKDPIQMVSQLRCAAILLWLGARQLVNG